MPLRGFDSAPVTVRLVGVDLTSTEARSDGADRWTAAGVEIRLERIEAAQTVVVTAPERPVAWIVMRWPVVFPDGALFLGDAWERSYGDLQWRHRQSDRLLPWYFIAHDASQATSWAVGVEVQPNAFCSWIVDEAGVSLWLDLRNGGVGALLGPRELRVATLRASAFQAMTAFEAASQFCRQLCPGTRRPLPPVCGNNNWYYAYGENFDAHAIRRDATFLAELSAGHENRPYCVIDAGWTPGGVCPGGPWDRGDPAKFPDMAGLAQDITRLGVHPGIWLRLTALRAGVAGDGRLRAGPHPAPERPLDLTREENLAIIAADVARLRHWGYRLLKHDFSTYDCFGRWGFEMGMELTDAGWSWADRTLTNAEILLRFYRLVHEQAGDMVVLGCNTVGHLAAGLVDLQRTGDDTSGKQWERTRKMGINTLAFRLPQHGAFFAVDADCAAHTAATPWALDRQYLDLVARSGTALFVSADPTRLAAGEKAAFRSAMMTALSGGEKTEPLDWLATTTPTQWRFGAESSSYHWSDAIGPWPFKC